jgi:hypothetical protein
MKLHPSVTSAVPAALAVASIALSLLILPGGASPARSSSVAPALRLVAGDVAAVVSSPVRAVTKEPNPAATPRPMTSGQQSSSSAGTHSRPAHRMIRHGRVSKTHPAARPHTAAHAAPASTPPAAAPASAPPVAPSVTERGRGKAKAWGHVRKAATASTAAARAAVQSIAAPGLAKAHGRSADVPHGPPAVPPGQAKHDQDVAEPGSSGKGGGGK